MLFEIINSATEDDIPRLLLSIQASRSLLKRRLYCETSTVSGKKKIIDIMKLIYLSLSDFSYYFPFPSTPLATFLPTAGVTITKMQSSYMFAKKKRKCLQQKHNHSFTLSWVWKEAWQWGCINTSVIPSVTASVVPQMNDCVVLFAVYYSSDLRCLFPIIKNKSFPYKYSLANEKKKSFISIRFFT